MMEVDHISYIFGSFSRRRQSQEVGNSKRRSIDAPKISHDRSNSAPHTSKKVDLPSSPRAKSVCTFKQDESKFKCPTCKKFYIEPRVLPCLHTFCTRCLQEMESNEYAVIWNKSESEASLSIKTDSSSTKQDSGSGGSGYESDKLNPLVGEPFQNPTTVKSLSCPVCGIRSVLPPEGVFNLPPHYLLQHRMVLATLNASSTRLLCDFCTTDVPATYRCTECAYSLCENCAEEHKRQRNCSQHEVLRLEEARRKGITRVRRQVMCSVHPERELGIFCSTCCQVICRECLSTTHKEHTCESASRAAKSFITNMREALERVRSVAKQAAAMSTRLQADSKKIYSRCNQVQDEVEKFVDSYIRALEDHRRKLNCQINETRDEKMQVVELQQLEVQKRLNDVKEVVVFTDELLTEGTDVEVLSFVKPILKNLEKYSKLEPLPETRISENLQFLPDEICQDPEHFCPVYGVVTTQTVSAKHCVLNQEGLQNLRVGRKAETILETRDSNDTPLQRGGETVSVELRQRDAGVSRSLLVHVEDCRNGSYRLFFTPDVAGKLLLSVTVNGNSVKDNPFPIVVRTLRPHHGTFHCCSFCSSGGSKEAACGCGGKMPGGYRGCGHGHDGHPGRRHWSCCGNVLEHSECVRANSTHYQFTL